jgi:hypothetical protein
MTFDYIDERSFGILLWEMMTFGGEPYATIPIEGLLQLIKGPML